eukprot:scaffold17872_cov57-Phaeocystis_antarctica.AAC.2
MKYACTMQCARDEDACLYAHARAVRLGTHGMRMRTRALRTGPITWGVPSQTLTLEYSACAWHTQAPSSGASPPQDGTRAPRGPPAAASGRRCRCAACRQ